MRILSIGEVLWDVIGDQEFLGGAPLNFSVSSRRLGQQVALLSAVGGDRRGRAARLAIASLGLDPAFVQTIAEALTGTAAVLKDGDGNATFEISRPAAFDYIEADDTIMARLRQFGPEWIYFGTLAQTSPRNEQILREIAGSFPRARCFYDMNLREGHWSMDLVQRLSGLASIIKLNENEAQILFTLSDSPGSYSVERFCHLWSSTYGTDLICVTLGSRGCATWAEGKLREFPGFPAKVADTVGAGDAFSAAFLYGFGQAWPMDRVARLGNAVGSIVASRAGATPLWELQECLRLVDS